MGTMALHARRGWIFFSFIGLILLAGIIFLFVDTVVPTGRDRSMGWHRIHGKYRVQYPEIDPRTGKNQISQPMTHSVAKDYAEMFDGVVVPK